MKHGRRLWSVGIQWRKVQQVCSVVTTQVWRHAAESAATFDRCHEKAQKAQEPEVRSFAARGPKEATPAAFCAFLMFESDIPANRPITGCSFRIM
jgi:hypothetical protein